MILSFSENCPIFGPDAEPYLHHLLYTVTIRRWHLVALPSPARLEGILPRYIWRDYGVYLTQAYKQVINSPQNIIRHPDCGACDPQKVADFYGLPVIVVVEDAESDGSWLEFVMSRLRPRLAYKVAGLNGGLVFHHSGGIDLIPRELHRISPRYRAARPAAQVPLRVLAFSDSDSKFPGDTPTAARAVLNAAESEGAMAHVLQKRTIENY